MALIEATRPQVAIVDYQLPGFNGTEVLRLVRESTPETGVLVLTALDDKTTLRRCMKAGAVGFLTKAATAVEIATAISSVAAGNSAIDPTLFSVLVTHFVGDEVSLAEREESVLACVAEGLSNDEIAERLFISPTSAKTYVSRLRLALPTTLFWPPLLLDTPKTMTMGDLAAISGYSTKTTGCR